MSRKTILAAAVLSLLMIGLAVYGTLWILRQPVPDPGDESAGMVKAAPAELQSEVEEPLEAKAGKIQVTLYVLASSGRALATEAHEIKLEDSVQQQAKQVVRLLLERSAAIPRGVQLRELFVTSQGVAYVDLSRELVANHPGGSSGEELTVFSLTNTLIANFPAIKLVKILVEGREIQTLAGHLDLTIPYGRGPSYLQPVSGRGRSLSNEAG